MLPPADLSPLNLILSDRLQDLDWESLLPVDWDLLVADARTQGVGPLLYWALSRSGKFSSLPEASRNALRGMYASTWMHNQRILKELEGLTRLFQQADIPLVALKGVCFALTLYPDLGLRPMGDMDLLVPASMGPAAVRLAQTLGYEDTLPEASPGLNDLLSHHACLQKSGPSPITLELHHSLVADRTFTYAVPMDWFWEQTEPLDAFGAPRFAGLRMLTPTAQVLYAAAHAMLQHGGSAAPLRWFVDLDRLMRLYAGRMDWDLLLSQARAFEWSSALDAALSKTVACFNTPIPRHVRLSLAGQADRHRDLVAQKQIRPATHTLEEHQRLLSLNWVGKIRLVLALAFPGPAYMRWRYQLKTSWLLPAFYLFRWGGIFKDALHTLLVLKKKESRVIL